MTRDALNPSWNEVLSSADESGLRPRIVGPETPRPQPERAARTPWLRPLAALDGSYRC
jgi:hypothetical protein